MWEVHLESHLLTTHHCFVYGAVCVCGCVCVRACECRRAAVSPSLARAAQTRSSRFLLAMAQNVSYGTLHNRCLPQGTQILSTQSLQQIHAQK